MKPKQLRLLPIAACLGMAFSYSAYAADDVAQLVADDANQAVDLKEVRVKGTRVVRTETVERSDREVLDREMIRDNRDLVRYSPDVGVADQGRHQKGFAIRGVEDNRVGMSIDDVALPDSEENSLYKRYGNLNTSRQSIDTELVRSVEVVKGADSFNQGSGNLGGGVNYRTLNASDIITDDNKFGLMLRSGHATRNREWTQTVGTAYQGEQAEAVLLYSNRRGHEMKSAGGFTIPEDSLGKRISGSSRQIPDSSEHQNHSFLGKFSWKFNENNRVGVSLNGQQGSNYVIEDSATSFNTQWREADDQFKRRTANAFYEYTPDSDWLSRVKVDVDYQKAVTESLNYEGTRAHTKSWGQVVPWEPSDNNFRTFTSKMKRLSLRADSQPLPIAGTDNTFSFNASAMNKKFDILHEDTFYVSPNWGDPKEWTAPAFETMMYPVKTRQYHFLLKDRVKFNNTFSGHAGVRYDYAKVQPQDLGDLTCRNCLKPKPADSTFKGWTWTLGTDAKLNENWKLAYNIGTGFRIPNVSEMYFDYRQNAGGAWMSNPNLKAERSLSQALSLGGNGSYGKLSASLHHTKYKDFLYEQETWEEYESYGRAFWRPVQQMQNVDKAKIYGLELTGTLNLDRVTPLPEGFRFFGSLGWNKGNMSNGADLLSLQPLKAIVGLDYEDPNGKWGMFSRLTYMAEKKAKDAKYLATAEERCTAYTERDNPYWPYWGSGPTERTCSSYAHDTELKTWPHLNKKAFVFDLFGYYKPTKNLTLRAGAYNIFNRKYHTWDSLRGINITGGLVNSVGIRPNSTYGGYPGLERFYTPGRNYAVSLEYKF